MFRKIQLIGNVGQDPEIRHQQGGAMTASFSVAVNESWKDRETGEKRGVTQWFRCSVWQNGERGLVTNLIQPWVKKGQLLYVEGVPNQREYIDRDGNKRFAFEVRLDGASTVRLLGGRKDGETGEVEVPARAPAGNGATQGLDPNDEVPF